MERTREDFAVDETADRPVRRRRSRIRRDAYARDDAYTRDEPRATRGGAAVASFAAAVARLILLAAWIVAGIIVAGILLVVFNANQGNDIVSAIHDAARWLVGPFDGMFTLDSSKATIAVNWGIAALVYLIVAAILARVIGVVGLAGARRRTTVA